MNQTGIIYGGDYNPEQWLDSPEILKQDIAYMKVAHINEVTLGIFAWSTLEPTEGEYHLEWMERILDELYANGISVILSTPSAARPKWLSDAYPEVLRVNADRSKNLFGGRHNHCYTSLIYREKVSKIDQLLSRRFGKHPAVKMWHISNELGGECHCPLCQKAFRLWLENKYKTIEQLNKAWNTIFWSHDYQSFSQIESPSPLGESMLHGLNLDWKRFVTDQTVDFVACEKKAIREGGSALPVTINMMYDFTGLNYGKFRHLIDWASWDNYPTWHKEEEAKTAIDVAVQHDLMRSLLKKPFLLMESCPTSTSWQSVSKLKRPGMLSLASLQAIAHGSDSVQYFQIRQSRGACEKFHGAVIDHYGGMDTRVFKEVTELGEHLIHLEEIAGSHTHAKVAIVHDCENRWAMENAQGPRNKNLHYMDTLKKIYMGLRQLGLDVDFIDMEEPLVDYDIVFAPMLYMLRCGMENKIKSFVKEGGTFVLTYWSGIVNETDLCYLGGTPHDLMDVFGLRSTELDALYDGEYNDAVPTIQSDFFEKTTSYQCEHFCDLVKVDTAETLLVYEKDFYAGYPALTCNHFGEGKAYYICADFEPAFYKDLCKKLVEDKNIKCILHHIPEGIEATTRETEAYTYLFIQNFNKASIAIELPIPEYEIIYGKYDGTVGKYETVVLRKQRKKHKDA